jgi:hypothetical protein
LYLYFRKLTRLNLEGTWDGGSDLVTRQSIKLVR